MLSQTRNQRSGCSDNTSATCRIYIYTEPKRIHSKESKQELIRRHIWPPNNHHTRQGNQKYPRAPQDHPKDTLSPFHVKTPPHCGTSHVFFLCQWETFPTHQIKEDRFQFSLIMQQQRKIRNYIWIKASEYQV